MKAATVYRQLSKDADLPHYANCVTAVRFVVRHTFMFELPRVFVFNMPDVICKYGWQRHEVQQLCPGDLLFVCKKQGKASHVAMVIEEGMIFHCHYPKGISIEDENTFFKKYPFFHEDNT